MTFWRFSIVILKQIAVGFFVSCKESDKIHRTVDAERNRLQQNIVGFTQDRTFADLCTPNGPRRSTHLFGVANHILAGFVEQVETANGIEQCIEACYSALVRYGFQCMSAMWYPLDKDQNCLLNSESKKTQQKSFIPEDTGHMMVYFQHPDAKMLRRFHDNVITDETLGNDHQWTLWSSCHNNSQRVRYQKCSEHNDVRKCPKESNSCANLTQQARKADISKT